MERPLRVVDLDHVVVRCRDAERSLDFYTRVLGCREERRIPAIGLVQLRAGASMIDLVPADLPPTHEGRNVDHVCLGIDVPDMDGMVRWLRAQGVEVLGRQHLLDAKLGQNGLGMLGWFAFPTLMPDRVECLPPRCKSRPPTSGATPARIRTDGQTPLV